MPTGRVGGGGLLARRRLHVERKDRNDRKERDRVTAWAATPSPGDRVAEKIAGLVGQHCACPYDTRLAGAMLRRRAEPAVATTFPSRCTRSVVAGRRHLAAPLPGRAIQRGPDLFLALRQLRQRHLECDALLHLIEIREDPGHDLLVLAVPSLGHIGLRHRLEIHRHFLASRRHRILLVFDTLTYRNVIVSNRDEDCKYHRGRLNAACEAEAAPAKTPQNWAGSRAKLAAGRT